MTGIDPMTMRRTMGRFATGVAIITTVTADGEPHGMTVNSLTSVSLDPPLLLVCFTAGARTAQAVLEQRRFAVSILAKRQEPIARRFAARGDDHFADLPLTLGGHGMPVVPGALAHLECSVERYLTVGDHELVVGQVEHAGDRDGDPLAFLSGRFGDYVARGHDPVPWFF